MDFKCIHSVRSRNHTLLLAAAFLLGPSLAMLLAAENPGEKSGDGKKNSTGAQFKGTADLVDKVRMVSNISADHQAATLLFENLEVSVGGIKGGSTAVTRSATVRLPLDSAAQGVTISQIVRGYADKKKGADAVLMMHAAGKTTLIDLNKHDDAGHFEQVISAKVPRGADYQCTFFLLAESASSDPDAGSVIQVDSLDLEIETAKQQK